MPEPQRKVGSPVTQIPSTRGKGRKGSGQIGETGLDGKERTSATVLGGVSNLPRKHWPLPRAKALQREKEKSRKASLQKKEGGFESIGDRPSRIRILETYSAERSDEEGGQSSYRKGGKLHSAKTKGKGETLLKKE